jgi:transcriptional regulator
VYLPESFRVSDREACFDLIEGFGFATLISWSSTDPVVSHVPLLLDRDSVDEGRLVGHVARANPHWKRFDGAERALAIFQGPHGYVSPSWYVTHPSVPTWNYAVVHVYGAPRTVDADRTWGILKRLIDKYEGGRRQAWKPDLPPEFVEENLRAIVGFEMPIARLEAKFKLSQNRDAADRDGALAGLMGEGDARSRELGEFMRRYLGRKPRD